MIATSKTTPDLPHNSLQNIKPTNAKKNITILTPKHINGICPQCYHQDSMLYPGSSFSLCIPCDMQKYFINRNIANNETLNDNKQAHIREKKIDDLISLGICPKCRKTDSVLYSGSSFSTCIPCDATFSLKSPAKRSKKTRIVM